MEKRPWALAGPPFTLAGFGVAIELKLLDAVVSHQTASWIASALFAVSGVWLICLVVSWWRHRKAEVNAKAVASLKTDNKILSTAIFWLHDRSAWGRWQRAFQQAKNDQELGERHWMWVATRVIEQRAKDGDLCLMGVPTGKSGYEPIAAELLQTRACLWLEPDDSQLWKVGLGPYSGTEDESIGILPAYDWLAVDMNRVKVLWPERDKKLDKKIAQLEREYRRKLGK
jgi:hypothetical protein